MFIRISKIVTDINPGIKEKKSQIDNKISAKKKNVGGLKKDFKKTQLSRSSLRAQNFHAISQS